jgi:hypothetical protein
VITHQSTLAVPILSTLAYNHTQDNHLDKISWIRTRAIEIVSIFKTKVGKKYIFEIAHANIINMLVKSNYINLF